MSYRCIGTVLHDPSRAAAQADALIRTAQSLKARVRIVALDVSPSDPSLAFAGLGQVPEPEPSPGEVSSIDQIRAAAEAQLRASGVAGQVCAARAPQAALTDVVVEQLRFCDLVVQDRPYGISRLDLDATLAEAVLFAARVPLLILPHERALKTDGSRVMVGWDNSSAALNAVRAALPLLQTADQVQIAMIDPPKDATDRSDPGGAVARFLTGHDVSCDIAVMARSAPKIGEVLLTRARDAGCDLLVMGAYGHSRLREAIFGGTTRYVLGHAEMPVLMAH